MLNKFSPKLARCFHFTSKRNIRDLAKLVQPENTIYPAQTNTLIKDLKGEEITSSDHFGVKELFTVESLFNARVHYGHHKGTRNEHMHQYLFGCRNSIDIFDLEQTAEHMHLALNMLAHVVYREGKILFVMHSHKHGHKVEKCAMECGEYAHTRTWKQNTFTAASNEDRSVFPDMLVCLSVLDSVCFEHRAITESAKVGIVTTAIVDSNTNPSLVTYPIPGNDDTTESIELYLKLFKSTILNAKAKRKLDLEIASNNQKS